MEGEQFARPPFVLLQFEDSIPYKILRPYAAFTNRSDAEFMQ
jgi:hypothetical protein